MAILFIGPTHIGDAVMASGVLRYLSETYPDDPITIACGAPAAKLYAAVPNLTQLHILRKRKYHQHWFDLWRGIVGTRWRVVVDLRRSAMPWMIWAGRRYQVQKDRRGIHRVALNATAVNQPPLDPMVWTEPHHAQTATEILADAEHPIALAPGASWVGKIWPSERFGELAERLTTSDGLAPGATIVLIGADGERETGQAVLDAKGPARIIDAFGLDVLSTFEVLRRCSLMVGNDSAMMHLAAATGIPTIGLFGPTKDALYGPWGDNGFVVRTPESVADLVEWDGYDTKTTGTMMGNLTVDAVLTQIDTLKQQGRFIPFV